nr:MAG: replication associated protein [Arizlama virus]
MASTPTATAPIAGGDGQDLGQAAAPARAPIVGGPPARQRTKCPRYVFTLNNWGAPDVRAPVFNDATMHYLCYGEEVAPGTGMRHLQGYVVFKKQIRSLNSVKAMLGCGDTVHLESAKGNELQNREYCRKGGVFHEFGTYDAKRGISGKRTDLVELAEVVKAGGVKAVVELMPDMYIKYHAGVQALAQAQLPRPRVREIHTTVLWGDTGTGKSHRLMLGLEDRYVVRLNKDSRHPFDQYEGQKNLVIEEFDPLLFNATDLNQYLDKWECPLACRYANKTALWTAVYITSNYDPTTWYQTLSDPRVYRAVQRRLSEPMGMCVQVQDQDQAIDLTWWIPKGLAAAAAPAPPPPPTPLQAAGSSAPAYPLPGDFHPALQLLAQARGAPPPRSPPSSQPRPLKRARAMASLFASMDEGGEDPDDPIDFTPYPSQVQAPRAGTSTIPIVIDEDHPSPGSDHDI